MSIHFFELKKVNKKLNPNKKKELWLQFINADSEEAFEMLKDTNVLSIVKEVNVTYDMSEDTVIKERAGLREKALHDEASMLAAALKEEKPYNQRYDRRTNTSFV